MRPAILAQFLFLIARFLACRRNGVEPRVDVDGQLMESLGTLVCVGHVGWLVEQGSS